MPTVSLYLSDEEYGRLYEEANRRDVRVRLLIRKIIQNYLTEKHKVSIEEKRDKIE